MRRLLAASTLAILLCSTLLSAVAFAETWGWSAQNKYETYPGGTCSLGDRPSIQYASYVVSAFPYWWSKKFEWRDEWAWESDLTSQSHNQVETCDFYIRAGHGFGSGRGPHFFNKNSVLPHDTEAETAANAGWSEIRWGGVKWATMYTCNFMNPESSKAQMFAMCEGIHFFVGFNQTMYMHSCEGSYYGWLLTLWPNPPTIIDAFTEAARAYQPGNSSVTRTVAAGHMSTFADTLDSYASTPPTYAQQPGQYAYLKTPL